MSNSATSCNRAACQGRPGKRGSQGPRGMKGERGDVCPVGTTDKLEEEVKQLKVALNFVLSSSIFDACAMGMKSRTIPNSAISVSSEWTPEYNGRHGRLDETTSQSYGVWHPRPSRIGKWFQVDFGVPESVSGVISQERPNYSTKPQFTKSYKVFVGNTTSELQPITENGTDKVFKANKDADTKVTNIFPTPVTCRYIRIYPQSWNRQAVLRVEFLRGECFSLY